MVTPHFWGEKNKTKSATLFSEIQFLLCFGSNERPLGLGSPQAEPVMLVTTNSCAALWKNTILFFKNFSFAFLKFTSFSVRLYLA